MRPENSATFAFCAVLPEFRGQGIGKALASHVISDLYQRGFTTIVTDWRSTNQQASQIWPAMGFTPTYFRLHRSL
jgi:ribosomal protein S18 acetylase RimI-like enzyme